MRKRVLLDLVAIGPESGQRWRREVVGDDVIRIGRTPQSGWDVPWDMRVSREHARFFQDETAGIFVFLDSISVMPIPGDLVLLEGSIGAGDFAPIIVQGRAEILGRYSIVSDADQIVETYLPLVRDVGAEVVTIQITSLDQDASIAMLGSEVLPRLRQAAAAVD